MVIVSPVPRGVAGNTGLGGHSQVVHSTRLLTIPVPRYFTGSAFPFLFFSRDRMAPDSPTRLVRNKSTSFGDFFRGSSSSSSRAAGSRNSQIPSSPTLPPPIPESNASPKKSAGRIPFLRSRRKSTHSTASGISQSYASESENEAALPGPSTRPRSGVDSRYACCTRSRDTFN